MEIKDSLLIEELRKRDVQSIIENIMKVREKASPILGRISNFFSDYTNHDVSHSDQVLSNLNWIIPLKVVQKFNIFEIQILSLACYLHDVGMAVQKKDVDEIKENEDFLLYKKQAALTNTEKNDDELLRGYVRSIHHKRSEKYIIENYKELEIENINIAIAVSILVSGHREENLLDSEKFDPRYYVVSGKDPVCLSFLAGCLRLADEVDITRVRTPELLLNLVSPRNPTSQIEWEKHKSTLAIGIADKKIKIQARCTDPIIHRSILLTAQKIEDTLDLVRKVFTNLPLELKEKYSIEIDGVMEPKIEEIGYLYRNFKFNFDTVAISKMLMGEKIYKSKYDSCRELIQNAIDTCRLKSRVKANWHPSIKIGISDDKKKLFVEDNGMGMDEFIIENYLLKVGRSYYTSTDFDNKYPEVEINPISEFGVGILSCFMIADSIIIETFMDGENALRLEINDIGEYVVVRPGSRREAGTRVELSLKDSITKDLSYLNLIEIVKHYVRHVEIPIKVVGSEGRDTEVIDAGYDFKLNELLDPFKLNKLKDYQILETAIDSAKYQGIVGKVATVLRKTSDGSLLPLYWTRRDFKDRFTSAGFRVSQRGIFVTDHFGYTDWYDGWFGEVNIERSSEMELRVSRDSFILSESENILNIAIQAGINDSLKELFENRWKNIGQEGISKITVLIIQGYITLNRYENFYMTSEIQHTMMRNFVFRVVKDDKVMYSTLVPNCENAYAIL